jgi:hypothetical protein
MICFCKTAGMLEHVQLCTLMLIKKMVHTCGVYLHRVGDDNTTTQMLAMVCLVYSIKPTAPN